MVSVVGGLDEDFNVSIAFVGGEFFCFVVGRKAFDEAVEAVFDVEVPTGRIGYDDVFHMRCGLKKWSIPMISKWDAPCITIRKTNFPKLLSNWYLAFELVFAESKNNPGTNLKKN